MSGLFALAAFLGYDPALRFYPHADGSFNTNLWVGNDFDVMEDYVCEWLNTYAAVNKMQNSLTENISVESTASCGEVNIFE